MEQMVGICKKYDVSIISDEIHMDILIKDRLHLPLLKYYDVYKNIYTASSCSKTLNVPGLIGSYAIIPDEKIRDAFLHQTRKKRFFELCKHFWNVCNYGRLYFL